MKALAHVEFQNVSFAYGEREVLGQLNFRVETGSVVCIIGRSGCGKTTLLKLISGQLLAQCGEVLIKGRALRGFSKRELCDYRKHMGYLFQQGALFTDLSVEENVAFVLREHTRQPEEVIRAKVKESLRSVDLVDAGNLYPSELSGGMIKRVALARATILKPDLLLYDEPFSGLDPITVKKIAQLIIQTNQKLRVTAIIVTHELGVALSLADQILLLTSRGIVFNGKVDYLKHSPLTEVHEFLDAAGL
ncbi:MAG: ATP-binding cassette domain-containing protein [Neisseriaceae bacterium]